MQNKRLLEVAALLEEGANADIYYDAEEYGDEDAANRIEETINAMTEAAALLREMAAKA